MQRVARFALLPTLLAVAGAAFFAVAAPFAPRRVPGLHVFFREGQTFITWTELGGVANEVYRIYRSDGRITPANLEGAELLATVPEGSCLVQRGMRKQFLEVLAGIKGYGQRFCIVDNPENDPKKMLPPGTGLFVNTVHKDGASYYAIVPMVDGEERRERMATLDAPVRERIMLPGAVLQWRHPNDAAAVYTHWMDYAKWDPLREGYAYNFGLAVPEGYDGQTPLPVTYCGHGMGGGYRCPDRAPDGRGLFIWHGDKSGSWFFGMMNRDRTRVVNYVEQRVRWSWAWLKAARPNQFFRVDPTRVQARGHSMGGTMATAFALRMGDIFCSTVSSAGATIHRRNRTWVRQASRLWGPPGRNLPTQDGVGVWDHQDYARWSLEHVGQETAFLLLSNGKQDRSVVFEPVPDFIEALERSKRPFAAHWDLREHCWNALGVRNEHMGGYRLRIDESLPAFAGATNNGDPRRDDCGTVNGNLEWSASGNDFAPDTGADDMVDTAEEYGINLRSRAGAATVDVTPRRLQRFRPQPGKTYVWENIDFSDPRSPRKIAAGAVKADRYGLVTVEKFRVGEAGWGNRLVIRPGR